MRDRFHFKQRIKQKDVRKMPQVFNEVREHERVTQDRFIS